MTPYTPAEVATENHRLGGAWDGSTLSDRCDRLVAAMRDAPDTSGAMARVRASTPPALKRLVGRAGYLAKARERL